MSDQVWQPIETAKRIEPALVRDINDRVFLAEWVSQDIIDQEWENADLCKEGWYESASLQREQNAVRVEPIEWTRDPSEFASRLSDAELLKMMLGRLKSSDIQLRLAGQPQDYMLRQNQLAIDAVTARLTRSASYEPISDQDILLRWMAGPPMTTKVAFHEGARWAERRTAERLGVRVEGVE